MANITYTENPEKLTVTIDIEFGTDDLAPLLKQRLGKLRREAQIKGFRKGKAPMSFIRKVYGPSALQEEMNKMLDAKLHEALQNDEYQFFGEPEFDADAFEIPKADVSNIPAYKFRFESAIQPQFEVKGLENGETVTRYQIIPSDENIDEAIQRMQENMASLEPVDEPLQDGDTVHVQFDELDEDGSVKENGWAETMEVLFNKEELTESFFQKLEGKEKGFEFEFNPFEVELNLEEEQVKKYLLKIGEADADVEVGNQFKGKIVEILRKKSAEINEDFFQKAFGPDTDVSSEEDARNKVRELLSKSYEQDSQEFLRAVIRAHFIKANQVPLPEAFLERKWGESLAKEMEGKSEEEAEHIRKLTLDNLRFTLIQGKLAKKYDIDYDEEELFDFAKAYARKQFQAYMPGQTMDEYFVLNMANRMLSDNETANKILQELLLSKIYDKLEDVLNIEDKKVYVEEFNEITKKFTNTHFPTFDPPAIEENTEEGNIQAAEEAAALATSTEDNPPSVEE